MSPPHGFPNPPRPMVDSSTSSSSSSSSFSWSWTNAVTLDLFLTVLHKTFLHPFIAWLIPLCLRAQATPYSHPSFISTTIYAILLTTVVGLGMINRLLAHGKPRVVELEDEVVLVTGGGSGLGWLVAQIYAMRGVSVAVLDVRGKGGKGEEELGDLSSLVYYTCDVGVREQVEEVKRKIEKDLGKPTILINCVAAPINGLPLVSLSAKSVANTIQSNLLSYFHTLQVFLPDILASETGGTIVTVSSVLSYLTAAGLSDYAATKAGVTAAHKTLEAELRVSGDDERVKMLLVETGQMSTPLFQEVETPNRFFAPVLEPVQVANEIVSMIDSGKGGTIRLPAFASLVGWYGVLPASIQRLARFVSGIDSAVGKGSFSAVSEKISSSSSRRGSESDVELIDV
ncbi:hypothetical protein AJ80_07345 [Polytolypa hystricis UAMH7299]|uniref:Uncharacterized protein n=1 Tax=Polytolypa hystricis (strain UAMH7299) TaxID=1447883 RepID=A0A2B7XQI5_POLH7|nr:hypothetical protein AJ80_07345 [Polytolypa hystricis UAMH7299]